MLPTTTQPHMTDLKLIVENIYCKRPIETQESEVIYDYSTHKLFNGIKDISRYNFVLSACKETRPYELSTEFLGNLSNTIQVVRGVKRNIKTIEDCIISFSKNRLIIIEIPEILFNDPLLTEQGDYTSFGILAILFGRFYNNHEFKTRVENDLDKLGFKWRNLSRFNVLMHENSTELSVLNAMMSKGHTNALDSLFYWRDTAFSNVKEFVR